MTAKEGKRRDLARAVLDLELNDGEIRRKLIEFARTELPSGAQTKAREFLLELGFSAEAAEPLFKGAWALAALRRDDGQEIFDEMAQDL